MSRGLLEESQHPLIDVINHVDDRHVNQAEILSLVRKTFIRVSQPDVWILEILEHFGMEVKNKVRATDDAEMKNMFVLINC